MGQICYFLWTSHNKKLSASGGFVPLTPHHGLCPWIPLGAPPPEPHRATELAICSSPSRNEILRTPLHWNLPAINGVTGHWLTMQSLGLLFDYLWLAVTVVKTWTRERTKPEENSVSDIDTTDCYQQRNGRKADNVRFMSRHCVYGQKRDLIIHLFSEAYTENAYNFLLTIPPLSQSASLLQLAYFVLNWDLV